MNDEAFIENDINAKDYQFIDMIMGEEKTTKWTKPYTDSLLGLQYEIFTSEMIKKISDYLDEGGNLFISGSYIGSDPVLGPQADEEKLKFISEKLKYKLAADHAVVNGSLINISEDFLTPGLTEFGFITELNDSIYNAEAPDALRPVNGSKTLLRYKENLFSAAVGYKDEFSIVAFGFPFETLNSPKGREIVMSAVINFFKEDK